MSGTAALHFLPLLGTAVVAAALAIYAWRQSAVIGATALACLALAVSEWSLGYALEVSSRELGAKLFWAKVQYAGIVGAPVAWLVLCARYAGRASWLSRRVLWLLLAIPAATLLLTVTNESHRLVWSAVGLDTSAPVAMLDITYGPWFWLHTAYCYVLMFLGSALLVLRSRYTQRLYRRQIIALLLSAVVPWLGNGLYVGRVPPFDVLDPTPFAFAISSLILGWAMFHDHLLSVVPVVRDAVIAGMRDALVVVDTRGRVADMNAAAEAVFGREASAAIGARAAVLLGEHPALAALPPAVREYHTVITVERGERRSYEVTVAPVLDRRGAVTGRLLMLHDITDRRRDEEARRLLMAELATVQRVARAINSSVGLRELFAAVVDQCRDTLGYEMVSIHLREAGGLVLQAQHGYRSIDRYTPLSDGTIGRVVRTGVPAFVHDPAADPDFVELTPGTAQSIILPLTSRDGDVLGALAVEGTGRRRLTDDDYTLLTLLADQVSVAVSNTRMFDELRAARAEAEAATRARSAFLAHMSHEIRTPMNGVVGVAELLLRSGLTNEQRALVEIAGASSRSLLALLNDTLDYAKLESRGLELARAPFDLHDCLEDALGQVLLAAAGKRVDVSYQLADGVPTALLGDSVRLRQILINLLSNAVKFTESGEVSTLVAARQLDDGRSELEFAVRDTGIGIPASRIGRLFQPFSQLDPTLSRHLLGSGLGLAISKQLSELMGGTMWAGSDGTSGSTFFFTVRLERAPAAPAAAPLAGMRLLLAEPPSAARQARAAQLRSLGAAVWEAGGADEAAGIASAAALDAVVIGLPAAAGAELAAALRAGGGRQLALLRLMWIAEWDADHRAGAELYQGVVYRPVQRAGLVAAVADARQRQLAGAAASVRPAAAPLRILMADDDPVFRQVFVALLRTLGHAADVVADGAAALQALQAAPHDLALLDVCMPGVDGHEVVRQVRAMRLGHPQPYIIAITGNAREDDVARLRAAGADDVLGKPLWLSVLAAALDRFAARRAQPRAAGRALDAAVQTQLGRLTGMFLEDAAALVEAMRAAVAVDDGAALARAAHRLKSSSRMFQAGELADACEELERSARLGLAFDAAGALRRIEGLLAAAERALGAGGAGAGEAEEPDQRSVGG